MLLRLISTLASWHEVIALHNIAIERCVREHQGVSVWICIYIPIHAAMHYSINDGVMLI
jgi:hypothetical protein